MSMKEAIVLVHGKSAGVLTEVSPSEYHFDYDND